MVLPGAIGPGDDLRSGQKPASSPNALPALVPDDISPSAKRKRDERLVAKVKGQAPTPPPTQPPAKRSTPRKAPSSIAASESTTVVIRRIAEDEGCSPETRKRMTLGLEISKEARAYASGSTAPPVWKGPPQHPATHRSISPMRDLGVDYSGSASETERGSASLSSAVGAALHPAPAALTPALSSKLPHRGSTVSDPPAPDIPPSGARHDAVIQGANLGAHDMKDYGAANVADDGADDGGADIVADGEDVEDDVEDDEGPVQVYPPPASFPGSNLDAQLCSDGTWPAMPRGFQVPESIKSFYENKSAEASMATLRTSYADVKQSFDQNWAAKTDAMSDHLVSIGASARQLQQHIEDRLKANEVLTGKRAPTVHEAFWIAERYILPLCQGLDGIASAELKIFLRGLIHLNQHTGPGTAYALLTADDISRHAAKFFHGSHNPDIFHKAPFKPTPPEPHDIVGKLKFHCPPDRPSSRKSAAAIKRGEDVPQWPEHDKPERRKGADVKMTLSTDQLSVGWTYTDTSGTFVAQPYCAWYTDLYERQWRLLIQADTIIARTVSRYNIDIMYYAIHTNIVKLNREDNSKPLKKEEAAMVRDLSTWRGVGMLQPRYKVHLSFIHCLNHHAMSNSKRQAVEVQRVLEEHQIKRRGADIQDDLIKISNSERTG